MSAILQASTILRPGNTPEYGVNPKYEDITSALRGVFLHLHGLHVTVDQTEPTADWTVGAIVHGQTKLSESVGAPTDYVQIVGALYHRGPGDAALALAPDTEFSVCFGSRSGSWFVDGACPRWNIQTDGAGQHDFAIHVMQFVSPADRPVPAIPERDWVLITSNENGRSSLTVSRMDSLLLP